MIILQGTHGQYVFNPQDESTRLGQGGMGVVFKGNTENNPDGVAIKVLYKEITAHVSAVERERQSAGIRITNKNLIRMLDFVEQNGIYHIVSELVDGKTLHTYLEELQQAKKKMDNATAQNIINQVMDGLIALHNNQPPVIHRDIDPSNIMICSDGTVKIMDFGIAKISDGKRKSLTGMGTVIGKPHYSPPEQIRGESNKISQTTDIYALGITIYEMLTGVPPFNATNEYDVMKMQMEKPLPHHAAIAAPVFKVIQKATEKKQERRYPTVADFKRDLNAAFLQEPAGAAAKAPKFKSLPTMLPLGLIALLTIAWIVTMISKQELSTKYESLYSTAYPVTVTDISFANTDGNGRILSDYGETIYASKARYLLPKLHFKTNARFSTTILLVLKYFPENEKMITNSFFQNQQDLHNSFSQIIPVTISAYETSKELLSFGSSSRSVYTAGNYRLEVWLGNVQLYTKSFTVKAG